MIPLDPLNWQNLNRMAVGVHAVNSREELHEVVSKELPATLGAERADWCEHGRAVPDDCACSSNCFHAAVLGLVLGGNGSNRSKPSRTDGDLGVFDLANLVSKSRLRGPALEKIASETRAKHYIVTQFFVGTHCGVLLMVRNSRPFTDAQKITLSLLREHLAIAARRHRLPRSKADHGHPAFEQSALSRREKEVLPRLVKGMTNPEIATTLGISPRTVEKHVASILDKSGLDNRRMLIGLHIAFSANHSPDKNG